jgi:hypothetical protein
MGIAIAALVAGKVVGNSERITAVATGLLVDTGRTFTEFSTSNTAVGFGEQDTKRKTTNTREAISWGLTRMISPHIVNLIV